MRVARLTRRLPGLLILLLANAAAAQDWQAAINAGDYERARVELERALAGTPDNTALRYELARVLGYAGRTTQALAEYDSLLARYPRNADYLLGRAQMLARLGRNDEALAVANDALNIAPDYPDVIALRDRLLAGIAPVSDVYSQWLTAGWGRESLSNGAPDWDRRFVRYDRQFDRGASYFAEAARSLRFNRQDFTLTVGGEARLLPEWRLGGYVAQVSDVDFEADRELSAHAARSWQDGWGTRVQLRRREYPGTVVSTYGATTDKYIAAWRVAYRIDYSRLHGSGTSTNHTVTLGWYPAESHAFSLALGAGDEIETIGLGQLLRTDVQSANFSGRHALSSRYQLNWWLGSHRQGDFYRRKYAGISVRIGL